MQKLIRELFEFLIHSERGGGTFPLGDILATWVVYMLAEHQVEIEAETRLICSDSWLSANIPRTLSVSLIVIY